MPHTRPPMPIEIPTRAAFRIRANIRIAAMAFAALACWGCSDIGSMTRHALGRDKVTPEVAAVRPGQPQCRAWSLPDRPRRRTRHLSLERGRLEEGIPGSP